ncbi:MAG TPA: DUF6152 family protein [Gammaproteobacteria bacterium]|jgi:hypothetical protein|nr:DUF6152 family protein [Gammaproteobacteria bacterium]
MLSTRFSNLVAGAALGTLLAAAPAQAHHSFAAEFDASKPLSLRGVVTKVELINPHSWITVDVKDATGNTVSWMVEGGSPNVLFKSGVTKASVPLGSELVIDGYRARDGSNRMVGRNISFADGRPLFFAGSKPDTAAAQQ